MQSSIPSITSGSMRTDFRKRSPPWTTRWPTAWMSARDATGATFEPEDTSQRSTRSTAARWSRMGSARRSRDGPRPRT
jgi:hypothetical protein